MVMRPLVTKWVIVIACCVSVIEAVYQIIFYMEYYPRAMRYSGCLQESDELEAFSYYQFEYLDTCALLNRTFKQFFLPSAFAAAHPDIRSFVDAVDQQGHKTSLLSSVIYGISIVWLVLDTAHIISSLILYWASMATQRYQINAIFCTVIPWLLVTFVIVICDTVVSAFAAYVDYTCRYPSTCVMWNHFGTHNPQLQRFDALADSPSELFTKVQWMPRRFLIIACRHIVGVPVLCGLLFLLLREYKRRTPPKPKEERPFVILN